MVVVRSRGGGREPGCELGTEAEIPPLVQGEVATSGEERAPSITRRGTIAYSVL